MTKRKPSLTVNEYLTNIFTDKQKQKKKKQIVGFPIEKALARVVRHMQASGPRLWTIGDYKLHVSHFMKVTGVTVLEEITAQSFIDYSTS